MICDDLPSLPGRAGGGGVWVLLFAFFLFFRPLLELGGKFKLFPAVDVSGFESSMR